ncbi:MAG: asparaginase [Muribaculaceae bacterium]|nr:asparaginase [Muribaculaceae bacterium]
MAKPRILILYTGGTIGMIEDPVTRSLRPFDFAHLIDNVPKIKMLDYAIEHIQFDPPIDSSDMTPLNWADIAVQIEKHYHEFDGFVVLHGTDTMAYTASALSFMLRGLDKPVIITGSQLPIGEVRTDGEENLITALQMAAAVDPVDNRPMIREVAILFENYLWRGNRSTKKSANNFNAFKSYNYPELARIGLGIHYNHDALLRPVGNTPLKALTRMETSVMFIDLFPGLTEATLRHQLSAPGIKGIVLRTYGAGNGPTAQWFYDAIRQAVERGIVIVNVTQCVNGGVHARRYYAGNRLTSAGVLNGRDMTSEAAITKLMHLFGQGLTPQQVASQFGRNICGEVTSTGLPEE